VTATTRDLHIELPMAEIAALCREYHVQELSLFGSVLRDDFRHDSDIDMLVLFQPDATIGILELAALQRKLGNLMHRNVDLVPKLGLKTVIKNEILNTTRIVYAEN
jgi:predicted nucleotidyltransferase